MQKRGPDLKGGSLPLFLLLLTPMCSSTPQAPAPASGDAIEAAVRNAEAELAAARGGGDA